MNPPPRDAGPAAGPEAGALARPASPLALFIAFSVLALQGFGGVLAVAQRELVDRRGWLSRANLPGVPSSMASLIWRKPRRWST